MILCCCMIAAFCCCCIFSYLALACFFLLIATKREEQEGRLKNERNFIRIRNHWLRALKVLLCTAAILNLQDAMPNATTIK